MATVKARTGVHLIKKSAGEPDRASSAATIAEAMIRYTLVTA
jgi:hypothetical protein